MSSFGDSEDDVLGNLGEALELYFEDAPAGSVAKLVESHQRFGDLQGTGATTFADRLSDHEAIGYAPDRNPPEKADVVGLVVKPVISPGDDAVADDARG